MSCVKSIRILIPLAAGLVIASVSVAAGMPGVLSGPKMDGAADASRSGASPPSSPKAPAFRCGADCETLDQIEAIQREQALIEAKTRLAEARGKLAADTGTSGVGARPADIDRAIAAKISIAGIYRRPDGSLSADLFVNAARVPVVVGSPLPSGFKVAAITPSTVDIRGQSGVVISLNFPGLQQIGGNQGQGQLPPP